MRRLFPTNTFVAPVVAHEGSRLVVAEAPGEEEQAQGKPLVGGSGRIFDMWLRKARIDREHVSIVNCINCRPPNNLFPTDPKARVYISAGEAEQAVNHCHQAHVEPLLKSKEWSRIDLLGEKALSQISGKQGGINKWRGAPVPVPAIDDKPRAVATFHPAHTMRNQELTLLAIGDLRKTLEIPPEKYNIYPSLDDVRGFTARRFAVDIETTYDLKNPKIKIVGLCAEPYKSIVVPWMGDYIPELQRIFANATDVIGHNLIQFDLPVLERHGIKVPNTTQLWDTMLMHHLRFPGLSGADSFHDLESVGSQFTNKGAWKEDKASLERYNARDVDVTWQIFEPLLALLKEEDLLDLYKYTQVPLAKICRGMHERGFTIDPSKIGVVRETLTREMAELEKLLPEQLRTQHIPVKRREPAPVGTLGKSGKPVKFILRDATETVVPWRSANVKKKFLYGKEEPWQLGLDTVRDPKKGIVSTDKIALDKLFKRSKNRAIWALKQLNSKDELMSTFCKEEMLSVSSMHPHFNPHGTSSGRLSSSEPNLQNIPESARHIYVPSRKDWLIVDVDYSQLENRLTALFAGDVPRLKRFEDDPNFSEHKYAASLFIGVPYDEVVKDNDKDAPYGKAKRIVHGTNYGMGAKKIADMYEMDLSETKALQYKWKQAIAESSKWQERTAERAKVDGYLRTVFGRKRWFFTSSYYTESLSFLPQSSGADIVFRCMIALMYERIGWPEELVKKVVQTYQPLPEMCELLLQVHDSLVFECHKDVVPELVATLKLVMEQAWPELGGYRVPIGVKVGESWGTCETYSPTVGYSRFSRRR